MPYIKAGNIYHQKHKVKEQLDNEKRGKILKNSFCLNASPVKFVRTVSYEKNLTLMELQLKRELFDHSIMSLSNKIMLRAIKGKIHKIVFFVNK